MDVSADLTKPGDSKKDELIAYLMDEYEKEEKYNSEQDVADDNLRRECMDGAHKLIQWTEFPFKLARHPGFDAKDWRAHNADGFDRWYDQTVDIIRMNTLDDDELAKLESLAEAMVTGEARVPFSKLAEAVFHMIGFRLRHPSTPSTKNVEALVVGVMISPIPSMSQCESDCL